MKLNQVAKRFKLTQEQAERACESMGIKINYDTNEVNENDAARLHAYAWGFLGFDPCK